VRVTSAFIRLLIRGLQWDATQNGATLDDTLKTAAQAQLTQTERGKVLIGTSSGGTAVQYTLPPLGSLTAQDIADVLSWILDRVDALRAATPGLTDSQLFTALLAEKWGASSFSRDYSALRV